MLSCGNKDVQKAGSPKVFDNISKIKKLVKPVIAKNKDRFVDKLLSVPDDILQILHESFSLDDYQHIHPDCVFKCNVPIGFSATVGNRANCWISGTKPDGRSLDDFMDREVGLSKYWNLLQCRKRCCLPK